eukprot:CAMPEP_0170300540 /NCGR_PEP_ID=MMETSP0116_2-20130129/50505_1 /TAXON_ID=400756 /ORGANISM="Durinskia baltica, Strain CSIRO CS-38" /LENGTH=41 /DNA_ID= /DNA_START= /DNA_END= /DNA_ORIENTATION=
MPRAKTLAKNSGMCPEHKNQRILRATSTAGGAADAQSPAAL